MCPSRYSCEEKQDIPTMDAWWFVALTELSPGLKQPEEGELQHWKQHRWQFDPEKGLLVPLVPESQKHNLTPNKLALQRRCRKQDLASMCMNLQVIFVISLVQLKVSPWREEVPWRKMLLGGPRNVPPWFCGCCSMCPFSPSSTSTISKLTAHPLRLLHSSNLEVKMGQLAFNYSPKKKLHWF